VYKTAEHTLFIGKNIVFVPECASTNDLALRLLQTTPTTEGTIVITDSQTAGRGQRGNTWVAAAKQNLTFSLILKPTFLPIKDQFFLNVFTSLALRDYLKSKMAEEVQIKWPNDILVNRKKIAGILIENQLQGNVLSTTMVGVGLNVLQKEFSIATATSLASITNQLFELSTELHSLLSFLEARYMQLRQNRFTELLKDYLTNLYQIHQKHLYKYNDRVFEGTIIGIDEIGKLKMETPEGVKHFGLKEISYM
jgi:BirA family transcriptional regulator, biotin operon repressor / biotin---[acetyl-CoA-carboxylase] ligase